MVKQLAGKLCSRSIRDIAGVLLLLHLGSSFAAAIQPPSVTKLLGTWTNTNPNGVVAEVVISGGADSFQVHPYAFCSPAPCDWGTQVALRFSDSIESTSAIGFQVTITSTAETDYMEGHLLPSSSGASVLQIVTQRQFASGNPTNSYEVVEDFRVSSGGTATPPALASSGRLNGTWVAVKSDGGLAQVIISENGGTLEVHPYGSCSPTYCDWGAYPAPQFSNSASSPTGMGFEVTININSEIEHLQGYLVTGNAGQTLLEITTQTQFTARGDTRNDYEQTNDFQLNATGQTGFSLTAASGNLTVQAGGQATDVITVTPLNGPWDSTVQLTCAVAGVSPMPSCNMSPGSVTPGAAAITAKLTITGSTTAALAPSSVKSKRADALLAAWFLVPVMGLMLIGLPAKERRPYWMMFGFLLLAVILPAACGGGGNSNTQQNEGTSYTVTVTGASDTIQQSIQINVLAQ